MATTSSPRTPSGTAARTGATKRPARRRTEPARRRLLLACGMVMLGSFMPWVDTPVGTVTGTQGAGLWTLYAAVFAFAGSFLVWRKVGAAHAGVLAATALVFSVWQVVHVLNLVGTGGWIPGPGLLLVFGGGILAASAAVGLLRPLPPTG